MRKAGYHRAVDTGSNRAGTIAGTHEMVSIPLPIQLLFGTPPQPEGFALGALSAEWIAVSRVFTNSANILF